MTSRVLITAGAAGIGRAMATRFDASGAKVWVVDIDRSALDDCPDGWQKSYVDVTDENAVSELFGRIEDVWGGLDTLCVNAGIAGPTAPIENVRLADWRRCVSVNLDGAFLVAKYAAPMMKRSGSGSIVITSSTAGLHGYPNRAPYCATKWGVIGLMKTLAMELGPHGIRCNALCPGAVEGPRMDGVLEREAAIKGMTREQVRAGYAGGTSLRTFVTADDVASMAAFLASKSAVRISGQVIAVDGHTENPDPKF